MLNRASWVLLHGEQSEGWGHSVVARSMSTVDDGPNSKRERERESIPYWW